MSTVETYETKEKLKCILTREEKEKMSQELVKAMDERDSAKAELDEIAANHKSTTKRLDNQIKYLVGAVKNGSVDREVAIEVTRDYVAGVKRFMRLDTYEVYHEAPLGSEDSQPSLPNVSTPESDNGGAE